jgi:hypothetical protein
MEVFVMKKFLNKPWTWGSYLKLSAIAYAITIGWYAWWMEHTGIFSTTGWLKEVFCKIKNKFVR